MCAPYLSTKYLMSTQQWLWRLPFLECDAVWCDRNIPSALNREQMPFNKCVSLWCHFLAEPNAKHVFFLSASFAIWSGFSILILFLLIELCKFLFHILGFQFATLFCSRRNLTCCLHTIFFFIAILLLYGKFCDIPGPDTVKRSKSNVYWTVRHCNSWGMKNQLDVTCYFISIIMRSTCFGH